MVRGCTVRPGGGSGLGEGNSRSVLIFLVFAVGLSFAPSVRAQGQIDPSLPPARLSYSRTLFLFPGVNTVKDPDAVVPPLTAKQKYEMFWERSFDRSLPLEAAFFAGISQAINYSPRYGQGWGAYADRFGSYSASIATTSFFADAFLPSLLHQDPRYFRKGRGSFFSRLLNSFESEVLTRTDSGGTTFNTSGMLGFGMSTALSNAWAPRHSITFSDTMQRLAVKLVVSSALNLFREFGGETVPAREAQDSH
jgi:hypothetical protein